MIAINTLPTPMSTSVGTLFASTSDTTAVYSSLPADDLLRRLSETNCVFSDADGTLIDEGTREIPPSVVDMIRSLASNDITLTLVTGKPYAEAQKLYDSLPKDALLAIICEKGAYELIRTPDGTVEKQYLLSSADYEEAVATLRADIEVNQDQLVRQFDVDGEQRVWLGWSGSGQHTSVISIDIYGVQPPTHYMELVGHERDVLKLQDTTLRAQVESLVEDFVRSRQPSWRVVHMGNGNTEIAPGAIEKDAAIKLTDAYQNARGVMVWGDSFNDRAMFGLRNGDKPTLAGLVVYRESSVALADEVDMVTFGMANIRPYVDLLVQTHQK